MKKALFVLALLVGSSAFAQTGPASPFWLCRLTFQGEAKGLQVLVGKFSLRSRGHLACTNIFGESEIMPVTVSFRTTPLAPVVAAGKYKVYGISKDVSLFAEEPSDLLGTWLVANGQAAVIGGLGAFAAVHARLPELSLQVSLQFLKGLGLNLGLTTMKIERAEAAR